MHVYAVFPFTKIKPSFFRHAISAVCVLLINTMLDDLSAATTTYLLQKSDITDERSKSSLLWVDMVCLRQCL